MEEKFPDHIDNTLQLMYRGLELADSLHYSNGQFAIYRALSGIEAYRGHSLSNNLGS